MSVEQLERIKQQISALSPEEKAELRQFLGTADTPFLSVEASRQETLNRKEERRRRRQHWLRQHRKEYGGRYVALDGNCLLGSGDNYPEAFAAARKVGVVDAYIDFVPPIDHVGSYQG